MKNLILAFALLMECVSAAAVQARWPQRGGETGDFAAPPETLIAPRPAAGSFNGWTPNDILLRRGESGWETRLKLEPGDYEYKLVIDGEWIVDPGNRGRRDDGNGNINSLLKVE